MQHGLHCGSRLANCDPVAFGAEADMVPTSLICRVWPVTSFRCRSLTHCKTISRGLMQLAFA